MREWFWNWLGFGLCVCFILLGVGGCMYMADKGEALRLKAEQK